MRFKLLRVRPHVWLFKQQDDLASSPLTDDNSCNDGSFVYKRSTSLKLIKSDPFAESLNSKASHVTAKPVTLRAALSSGHIRRHGKNAQVCTVVDAGCTCRATVTSQHKNKRAEIGSNGNSIDAGSLHDVCRPRRTQVTASKGLKHEGIMPKLLHFHANPSAKVSQSPGRNGGVVSWFVCKSSDDVTEHAVVDSEEDHLVGTLCPDKSRLPVFKQAEDAETSTMTVHDHKLECRLRSAEKEEQKQIQRKKTRVSSKTDSLTSTVISSNLDTSASAETLHTMTTCKLQGMSLNSNPAFDMDIPTLSDHVISLDDLRTLIAQRKLASPSPSPASLHAENARLVSAVKENSRAPSPVSLRSIHSANSVSPHGNQPISKEYSEVRVKHVDVGIPKRRNAPGSDEAVNIERAKQCQRATTIVHSKVNGRGRDNMHTPKRATNKKKPGIQKDKEAVQCGNSKTGVKGAPSQGHRWSFNNNGKSSSHEIHSKEADTDAHASNHNQCELGIGADEEKLLELSPWEIQVLSDCIQDNPSDSSCSYPLLRIHLGGTSPTSSSAQPSGADAGPHISEEGESGHDFMRSKSAIAMVKSSYDPRQDFKESMTEMVAVKQLHTPRQLQQLLQCYLSLNPPHYHPIIINVLHELCSELFQ